MTRRGPAAVRRFIVFSGAAVLLSTALPKPAEAHPARTFDACVQITSVGPCRDRDGLFEGVARFQAKVLPRHIGATVLVRMFDPDVGAWRVVGHTAVHRFGSVRWKWEPDFPDDIERQAYRWRFAIPGHGRSDGVKVLVFPPDI